jgi:hypothetical protein
MLMIIRPLIISTSLLWLLAGCSDNNSEERKLTAEQAASVTQQEVTEAPTKNDPCSLVSQAEMEQFTGPLREPPYRINQNYEVDPSGSQCLYRSNDYRYVILDVDWESSPVLMQIGGGKEVGVDQLLAGSESGANELAGSWDKAMLTFGRLMAIKGATEVTIDPLGSTLDRAAQARIAALALSHAESPHHYNGAEASRTRPADPAPPDPCSLLTKAEAESFFGLLRADPVASEDGSECVYTLQAEMFGTPIQNSLKVLWRLGFYNLGMERLSTGIAQKVMTQAMGEIPDLAKNNGAKEPWDDEQLLLGGLMTVVSKDILFQTVASGINGFDEGRARELLRLAVARAFAK